MTFLVEVTPFSLTGAPLSFFSRVSQQKGLLEEGIFPPPRNKVQVFSTLLFFKLKAPFLLSAMHRIAPQEVTIIPFFPSGQQIALSNRYARIPSLFFFLRCIYPPLSAAAELYSEVILCIFRQVSRFSLFFFPISILRQASPILFFLLEPCPPPSH